MTVLLIYRKTRSSGNFSMETSFDQMLAAFPADSPFRLEKFVSSHYSNGILPRLRAVREAGRQPADLYHITGDVHYLALGLPGDRTVLTVHDCGFMNDYRGPARRLLKAFWLDLPVRRCRAVTAVSEATKRDIIRYTGCPPEKIRVIPTVINTHFRAVPKAFDAARPRILHIGLAPNKNFERHLQALRDLPCSLHIIGKLEDRHRQLLAENGIEYESEYNISDEAMQQAYERCDLLLFASTLEGFGMPIVEAQTVGRPVVTSNLSSMPEVAGDAACLVDPYDVAGIRAGVQRVIKDAAYREELVAKGFENVRRFSAEAVAKAYEEIYQYILDGGNNKFK